MCHERTIINNTMNTSLKLALLRIRAAENELAYQEKKEEEFYDCDSATRTDDVTTEHLDDSSEQLQFF